MPKLASILILLASTLDVGAQIPDPRLPASVPDEISITIVLKRQKVIDQQDWARTPLDGSRREAVIETLRTFSAMEQRALLGYLETNGHEYVKAGSIRPLWICNAVGFTVLRQSGGAEAVAKSNESLRRFMRDIAKREEVDLVYRDVHPFTFVTGCTGSPSPCAGADAGLPEAQALGNEGAGIVVAVADSGIELDHPDLAERIWTNPGEDGGQTGVDDDGDHYVDDLHGYNFASREGAVSDSNGHGTNVSGVIAGDGSLGVATGVAPRATIMPLRILGAEQWSEQAAWEAIQYAVQNGAHIINLSLAPDFPNRVCWRVAIEHAAAAGVPTVAAAGNEGACLSDKCVRSPGDVPSAITVGATRACDHLWRDSSRGPVSWADVDQFGGLPATLDKPEVVAPGVDVCTTCLGSSLCSKSGTSLAAPNVAGVLALMLAANPMITNPQLVDCLLNTTIPLTGEPMEGAGHGRVDPFAAVKCAVGQD